MPETPEELYARAAGALQMPPVEAVWRANLDAVVAALDKDGARTTE